LKSEEGKALFENFNYGQKCLLTGLIELCVPLSSGSHGDSKKTEKNDPFKAASITAKSIAGRATEMVSLFPTMGCKLNYM